MGTRTGPEAPPTASPPRTLRAAWPRDLSPVQAGRPGASLSVWLCVCWALVAFPERRPGAWVPLIRLRELACPKIGQGLKVLKKEVPRLSTPPSWSLGTSEIPSWGHLEKTEESSFGP